MNITAYLQSGLYFVLIEKAWDISTAVISIQVSEQAILHSTTLYRLPSTAQPHSESFTSLLCALSPVKNNKKKSTKYYFSGQVWCQASCKTWLKHNQMDSTGSNSQNI
jgi:hypothetical protein